MTKEMRELVHQAKMLGCGLFVGDKITLITYDKHGEVDKKYHYNYDEVDHINRIQSRLDGIAKPLRKKWGREFHELSSVAFSLGYSIIIGDYSAVLLGTTNPCGEVSKEETHLLECPFSSTGLHEMNDYIANQFLGGDDKKEKKKEEGDIMENEIILNPELARVIAVMFYSLTAAEQQRLKNHSDEVIRETITEALKISAKN